MGAFCRSKRRQRICAIYLLHAILQVWEAGPSHFDAIVLHAWCAAAVTWTWHSGLPVVASAAVKHALALASTEY